MKVVIRGLLLFAAIALIAGVEVLFVVFGTLAVAFDRRLLRVLLAVAVLVEFVVVFDRRFVVPLITACSCRLTVSNMKIFAPRIVC